MKQSLARLAAVALVLLTATACDKATPVAPGGTVLTISASPTKIGLNGSSTITVVGRKPTGQPLNPGTEIRFSVDKGTISPAVAGVNDSGIATATLRGDGRSGIAKVSATTGDGMTTATIDVQIGETTESKPTVLVSANPNTIPAGGGAAGTSTITVIARNSDGSPVTSGDVTVTTTLGMLDNTHPALENGTATAKLTSGSQGGTAKITAFVGASDAATADVTIRDVAATLSLSINPTSVSKSAANSTVTLTALVSNAQSEPIPNAAVTFTAETGEFDPGSLVLTNSSGIATVTLKFTSANLASFNSVQVTASTPGAGGSKVDDKKTITVTN
jgi:adhesin/invasin